MKNNLPKTRRKNNTNTRKVFRLSVNIIDLIVSCYSSLGLSFIRRISYWLRTTSELSTMVVVWTTATGQWTNIIRDRERKRKIRRKSIVVVCERKKWENDVPDRYSVNKRDEQRCRQELVRIQPLIYCIERKNSFSTCMCTMIIMRRRRWRRRRRRRRRRITKHEHNEWTNDTESICLYFFSLF